MSLTDAEIIARIADMARGSRLPVVGYTESISGISLVTRRMLRPGGDGCFYLAAS